jgi:hypothetical protein
MEPAYKFDPARGEALEIPSLRTFDRVSGIIVIVAASAVFALMALAQTNRGHEIGYLFCGLGLWWALYYASLPRIKVALDPAGIEFADMSCSVFLWFSRHRVAWHDVVEVGSRTVTERYGSYIETQVTVKISEVPLATRRFSVTSRDSGYDAFLKMLEEHVAATSIRATGMGIEQGVIRRATSDNLGTKLRLLFVLFAFSSALIILAWIIGR